MDITDPHDIQRKILTRLGYHGSKKFSELRGGVPSNKFSFHLDKLQEKELVEKQGEVYRLTAKGTEVLPYLKVRNIERPITVVDLFLYNEEKEIYLERKEDDPLDATSGKIRPPSTRAVKDADLKERAKKIYRHRFEDDVPELELVAVFESATRFGNGALQDHILFYFGAEVDQSGENWFPIEEIEGESFLPGMKEAAKKLVDSETFVHGIWNLKSTQESVELGKIRFLNR